jgi:hypothetical protein
MYPFFLAFNNDIKDVGFIPKYKGQNELINCY